MRLIGSPGQRNDITFANDLIEGCAGDATDEIELAIRDLVAFELLISIGK